MWRLVGVLLVLSEVLALKFAGPLIGGEVSAWVAVAAFLAALLIFLVKLPSHIKESIEKLDRPVSPRD